MSGEAMDDDDSFSSEAMAGLLNQPVKPCAESSSRSGSGSWGTCAELLLVSAVKKHGVPNWNLVALELKSRAMLLNTSPSDFSEEACKFRYNALKGKFACTSSSGMSLDDHDREGMSWFEELRKLRMSHLKEELELYDSSIGQLQSRISILKDERAQLPSVMKQCESSICGVDMQLHPKACNSSEVKTLIPARRSSEPFQILPLNSAALEGAAASAADISSASIVIDVSDKPDSSVIVEKQLGMRKNVLVTAKLVMKSDSNETVVVDLTAGKKAYSSREFTIRDEEGAEKALEEQVDKDGVFQIRDNEFCIQLLDPKSCAAPSHHATIGETSCSAKGEENLLPNSVLTGSGSDDSELQPDRNVGGAQEIIQLEGDIRDSAIGTKAFDLPGQLCSSEAPALVANGDEVPPRALDDAGTKNFKVELNLKKEPRQSRLSLSYRCAEKEKRLKAGAQHEELNPQQTEPWPAMREDVEEKQRIAEATETYVVEGKLLKDSSLQLEQARTLSFYDTAATCRMENETTKQHQNEFDSSSRVLEDGADKVSESKELGDEKGPIFTEFLPSNVNMLPGNPVSVFDNGIEPRSAGGDILPLATLSVVILPDTDLPPSVDFASLTVTSSPDAKGDLAIAHTGPSEPQPTVDAQELRKMEAGSSVISVVSIKQENESEERPEVLDDVGVKGETLNEEQKAEMKVEVVDMVDNRVETEMLGPDSGRTMSFGDDVTATLDTEESGFVQEESRDGPDTVEGQQPFPDSTDSQIDKSEVGSSMDSIEDMSPSSRKNRREPKVPGKFLPLLECLRVICAHKFAPLFRQRQEYQDNAEYDRLVRRHVDLNMVRARLEEGAYSGSVEFFRDLLLIFTNALVYTSSESQEFAGAKALRSCALTEMDKILQTEALLKLNGPATRKREVRKSMEVHRARVSSTSGSEGRKKGILKGHNEGAALDLQGGARSAHLAFEDTPYAGRSSNSNEEDRDLDGRIEASGKMTSNRILKDETQRKESQKSDFVSEASNPAVANILGKKGKFDGASRKASPQSLALANPRTSGWRLIDENAGTKISSGKMKDVMYIDLENKGSLNVTSGAPSGLATGKQQTSTSRVSRNSKRARDSTTSYPKKRVRK